MNESESLTKLKDELREEKLVCFNYLRTLSRLTREELDNAGYRGRSNAEAIKMSLDQVVEEIELKVRRWEKANPDA